MAVLLATLDGARFLPAQLQSLAAQSWPDIDIWASDDGSGDQTLQMLEQTRAGWTKGAMHLLQGPHTGIAADNFRQLLIEVAAGYDYLAFCDQDDIWLPEKLEQAIADIAGADAGRPALRCSRTRLIDERGGELGLSVHFRKAPDFRNALVQSIAGGNTMVLNRAAAELLKLSCARTSFVSHDWWAYQIISGAGGQVIYSATPDTLYRQHDNNVVGSNLGLAALFKRTISLFRGNFRRWNERNVLALDACRDLLTASARKGLADFEQARHGPVWQRLAGLIRSRVFRQTVGGQIMLYVACVLGVV